VQSIKEAAETSETPQASKNTLDEITFTKPNLTKRACDTNRRTAKLLNKEARHSCLAEKTGKNACPPDFADLLVTRWEELSFRQNIRRHVPHAKSSRTSDHIDGAIVLLSNANISATPDLRSIPDTRGINAE
jgi:hypothetical protein